MLTLFASAWVANEVANPTHSRYGIFVHFAEDAVSARLLAIAEARQQAPEPAYGDHDATCLVVPMLKAVQTVNIALANQGLPAVPLQIES